MDTDEQLLSDFKRGMASWAGAVEAHKQAPPDLGFAARLAAAIELREDGEPEASAKMFEALFADGGGDAEAALEYAKTLRKLNRAEAAERVLSDAINAYPSDFEVWRAWSELPRHAVNYEGTIARGRLLREKFPPPDHPGAWQSLAVEFDCFYEMAEWDRLKDALYAHWDQCTAHPEILPDAIAVLNKLFLTDEVARLAREAAPQAWRHLSPEACDNLLKRSEIAALNLAAVERIGIKLVVAPMDETHRGRRARLFGGRTGGAERLDRGLQGSPRPDPSWPDRAPDL